MVVVGLEAVVVLGVGGSVRSPPGELVLVFLVLSSFEVEEQAAGSKRLVKMISRNKQMKGDLTFLHIIFSYLKT